MGSKIRSQSQAVMGDEGWYIDQVVAWYVFKNFYFQKLGQKRKFKRFTDNYINSLKKCEFFNRIQ